MLARLIHARSPTEAKMRNPNNNKLTLNAEEKRDTWLNGNYYTPAVVRSYDPIASSFLIAADERYVEKNRDTAFLAFSAFTVPANAIYALVGDDRHDASLPGYVGLHFLMN
jgi:hypothetical protein